MNAASCVIARKIYDAMREAVYEVYGYKRPEWHEMSGAERQALIAEWAQVIENAAPEPRVVRTVVTGLRRDDRVIGAIEPKDGAA